MPRSSASGNVTHCYLQPELERNACSFCNRRFKSSSKQFWIASDGSEQFGQFRLTTFDPLEQSYIREVRLEQWVEGKLDKSEEYTLHGNIYFKEELVLTAIK